MSNSDPDANQDDPADFDDYDDPDQAKKSRPATGWLGNLFETLEKLTSSEAREGEINQPDGYVIKWGIRASFLDNAPASRPASAQPQAKPPSTTPPVPSEPPVNEAGPIQSEPLVEIHAEEDSDRLRVIIDLQGLTEEQIEVELHGDILIVRVSGYSPVYEKEFLLPCTVQPIPHSRHYHNGLLELIYICPTSI